MTIGVGVEGPSDRIFWHKVLHKHFRNLRFDIRSMKGRGSLIRDAQRLLETFRNAHYTAGFLLIDRDQNPCITSVIQEFDAAIQTEARKLPGERFLNICVAVRELEAWYIADETAVANMFPASAYTAPVETGSLSAVQILEELWRAQYGRSAFNKLEFARIVAPHFSPKVAAAHSASFNYFWERMSKRVSA